MKFRWILLVIALTAESSSAERLVINFSDPTDDFSPSYGIDLTGMKLLFDNSSGDYDLLVTFDFQNPFQGTYNVNANLFNTTVSPSTKDPAYVGINRIATSNEPVTQLVFSGTNTNLISWVSTHVVANNSQFGNPSDFPNTFLSGVADGGAGIDILEPATSIIKVISDDLEDDFSGLPIWLLYEAATSQ